MADGARPAGRAGRSGDLVPWSVAWRAAAHGPLGFYGHPHGHAEDHFVTPVTSSDRIARGIVTLVEDELIDRWTDSTVITVTDVGAGNGTLLAQLRERWPRSLRARTRWRGIDLRERPSWVAADIEWVRGDIVDAAPGLLPGPGIVVAHELLDDIPCEVVEADDDGQLRLVLVSPETGMQHLGPLVSDVDGCALLGVDASSIAEWCARWWPRTAAAARIEVGIARDHAWLAACSLVDSGVAIAIDYAHVRSDRGGGQWDGGTLAGYRDGRVVSAVPDGTCNITAHVALDACAAAAPALLTRLTPTRDQDDYWWLVQWLQQE